MQTSVSIMFLSLKTASFVLHRKIIHPLQHRHSSLATAEQYIPLPRSKAALLQPLQAGSCRAEAATAPVVGLSGQVLFHKESRLGGTTHNGKDGIYTSSCWSNIASSRHEVNDLKVRVSLHVFEDAVCITYRTATVALLVKWHQTTSTNMSSRKNPAEKHLLRTCKSIEVAVEDLWVYLVLLEHVSCFFTSLRQILRKIYSASECN